MESGSDGTPPASGRGSVPPRPTLPTIPSVSGGDWPAQAADVIVTTVDRVRDRTTIPIMKLARAAVFGVFIGTFVIVLCALLLVGLVRFLDLVIPGGVWIPYLILGLVLTGAGWLLFRKRNESPSGTAGNPSAR